MMVNTIQTLTRYRHSEECCVRRVKVLSLGARHYLECVFLRLTKPIWIQVKGRETLVMAGNQTGKVVHLIFFK